MKKKLIALISLVSISLIILIIFITTPIINFSPEKTVETCKTLSYNGEGKIDIVFFGQKNQADQYSDYFLKTSPFENYRDNFNFYYIDDYNPTCELYKDTAILCYSSELISKASECPNDYIIVLEDRKKEIRSSSFSNVLSINTEHSLNVLIHEFGHAFANLADEYTPAKLKSNQPNCMESCDKFLNPEECYQGCSDSSHYRSIDQGVMRTLQTNEYGEFNEIIIIEKIKQSKESGLTGFVIGEDTDCKNQRYYLIGMQIKPEYTKITNKELKTGCIGENSNIEFEYDENDKSNLIVNLINYNQDSIYTDELGDTEITGETYDIDIPIIIKIPVIENIETMEIQKDNQTLITLEV